MTSNTKILKNGLIVTVNPSSEIYKADILIENSHIKKIGTHLSFTDAEELDANGFIIIPGLIQTHVHLCQTLFRNRADDLALLDWLSQKIWPFESMHTPDSLRASARLGIAELLLGGTTTLMDMGTIHYMDVVFEEILKSGIRAFCGKTMMDFGDLPVKLKESTKESIDNSLALLDHWHNADMGRVKYAFAPRFVVSCTRELLAETARLANQYQVPFHTHAAENLDEIKLVEQIHNDRNIIFLEKMKITAPNLCLAHCIWLDKKEIDILKQHNIKVLHCPSSNLKLGSGIAPVPEYLNKGITVSLGADGAPCNNNLSMFQEMRLAALIQKPRYGPTAMDAETVFRMATIEGAKALNLENEIGSIETGKKADLTFVKINQVHSIPFDNIYSKLVYSANASDVMHVMVNGKWVVKNRELINDQIDDIIKEANSQIRNLLH